MSLQQVPAGRNLPDEINVIIEVPMNSPAIKYEIDKESGAIFVDRMLKTAMYYPCNYGYVPHSLCGMEIRWMYWLCCPCHWCPEP